MHAARRLRPALALLLLRPGAAEAPAAPPPPGGRLGEMVVEGRHGGPRLGIVRQGEHTLWILGTISPLPKRLVWPGDAVREVLKQAQEVVPAWPSYGIGANPL